MLHHTQHHSRIHLCTLLHHTQQQQLIKHLLHIPNTRLIQQHIHQHLILLLKQRLTLQFIHRLQHILPCLIHHIQRILTRLIHPQHRTTLILQVHILRDLTEATFLHAWVKNVHISLWKKRLRIVHTDFH
uniref:Putative ovule protein n=1 Tax=Solanum chacoense TaxID=4108 RepID=A0A0V0H1H9_SOLCH